MKKNLIDEVNRRIKEAKDSVMSHLNPDDPDLISQISLGDQWDDPQKLSEALDMHPLWSARWSYLLKTLKNKREKVILRYKTWESIIKDEVSDEIFQENLGSGMTANNSRPTAPVIDRKFNKKYVDSESEYIQLHTEYLEYSKSVSSIESKIDSVQVVVDAFQIRTQMLIQMGGLLRSLIDNKIIINKKKHG